jgi:hypothetical protein
MPHPGFCLFCLGPPTNGAAVCSAKCDDGWWRICPTIDGDLWEPEKPEEPPIDVSELNTGMPPTRACLNAPPQPDEAAGYTDLRYIDATRLRQNIAACNP